MVLGLLAAQVLLICWSGRADTLFVSSVNGDKIYRVTTNGTVTPFATVNLLPEGLAFNASGVLFVGNDGANSVNRVSASGFVSTFATNVTQPYGLGFDSKGNLYAACQSSPVGRVRKITPQGSVTNFGPSISAPYGLAVDQADNVYVASMGTSRIYKIAPDGSSSYFGPPVNSPQGMAFDRKGNLFVAASSGTITKITPAGVGSSFATGLGSSLVGLAFDNEGNLFAAHYVSGTIWKLTTEGSVSILATVPGNPSFLAVFPPPAFDPGSITVTPMGNDLVLSWQGNFVLQTSPNIAGPYKDVLGASSPYTNTFAGADTGFFRLKK
jgi:hypothetical protein